MSWDNIVAMRMIYMDWTYTAYIFLRAIAVLYIAVYVYALLWMEKNAVFFISFIRINNMYI